MDIHVCLVSAQTTPNLIPVLDRAIQPKHMVLVTSPDMEGRSRALASILKRHRMSVEFLEISNAYDYPAIEDTLIDWLAEHEDQDVGLNVTGGTKLMAMAAQAVFTSSGKPIYYINAETDEILYLGDRAQSRKLDVKIGLRDYLEAHGYQIEGALQKPQITRAVRDLIHRLAIDAGGPGSEALGMINYHAQQAIESRRSSKISPDHKQIKDFERIAGLFEEAGYLSYKDNQLVFPSEEARQFVNGGWLEYLAYDVVTSTTRRLGIGDACVNLKVIAPDGSTRNELDVAFMHENRLNIIETKSGNLDTLGSSGEQRSTEAIYKLQSLLRLGGLRTRAMLLDYRGGLGRADRNRALESGIHVVGGEEIQRLRQQVEHWLSRS